MKERNIFNFIQSTHWLFKRWCSIWKKKEKCFQYKINQELVFLYILFFFLKEEINIIALPLISGDGFSKNDSRPQDFFSFISRSTTFSVAEWNYLSDLISSN